MRRCSYEGGGTPRISICARVNGRFVNIRDTLQTLEGTKTLKVFVNFCTPQTKSDKFDICAR
jgi:hypothetical protein